MEINKFNFWQDHSTHYLEMALGRDRCEVIEHPDGYGKRTGDCGDTVEMFLTVRDDRISSVSFEIKGCINTTACANTVAELAEGRKVKDAWAITPDDVVAYLENVAGGKYRLCRACCRRILSGVNQRKIISMMRRTSNGRRKESSRN